MGIRKQQTILQSNGFLKLLLSICENFGGLSLFKCTTNVHKVNVYTT